MGINKDLGLPFGKGMQKVAFAFDVDGTLIDDDSIYYETFGILTLMLAQPWKNVDIIVWSGGGAEYAETIYRRLNKLLSSAQPDPKFYSKLDYKKLNEKYDRVIAVDDVQDTRLGDVNLIVRNK